MGRAKAANHDYPQQHFVAVTPSPNGDGRFEYGRASQQTIAERRPQDRRRRGGQNRPEHRSRSVSEVITGDFFPTRRPSAQGTS